MSAGTLEQRVGGLFTPSGGADVATGARTEGGWPPTFSYWKKEDGWVVAKGSGPSQLQAGIRANKRPLPQYGAWDPGEKAAAKDAAGRVLITHWNTLEDPYRLILHMGGIGEFPADQILELGWHRTPHPILEAQVRQLEARGMPRAEAILEVMPQLRGVEWGDYPCEFCGGRKVFNTEANLRSHEIAHREDARERRMATAMGSSIQEAMVAVQAGNTAALVPILERLAEQQARSEQFMQQMLERLTPAPGESKAKAK